MIHLAVIKGSTLAYTRNQDMDRIGVDIILFVFNIVDGHFFVFCTLSWPSS